MRRFFLALASTALTVGMTLALALFLALGTGTGQDLVRHQTEAVLARLLGPDVTAMLGEQAIDLGRDGNLALRWSNVRLMSVSTGRQMSEIRAIKVGFALLPLLTGRLEFRTIDVAGAAIDLTSGHFGIQDPDDGPIPTLPARSARWLAGIEKQMGTVARLGLEAVTLSDIELMVPLGKSGDPFVAEIDEATVTLAGGALGLSALIDLDDTKIPVAGTVALDGPGGALSRLSAEIGPIDLAELIPPGDVHDVKDMRPFATDADGRLRLDVLRNAADGKRIATLSVDLGPGAVQAGRGHTNVRSAHLGLSYVEGEDAIELDATRLVFDGFETGLDGRAVALYDRPGTGEFNGFGFALQSRDMRSTVGSASAKPLEARFVAEGRSDSAGKALTVSKLTLATGTGSIGGSAALRYGAPEAVTSLHLAATNLAAPNVKAFWPFNISVNTRRWVLEHVGDTGNVPSGTIALDVRHDRMDPAFKPGGRPLPEELDIALALKDARFRTVAELPELSRASGAVRTSGVDTVITLDTAHVEGFDAIAVAPSSLAFLRSPDEMLQDVDGTLAMAVSGPLPDLLSIAARPPINALRTLDIKPEDAEGTAKVAVTLAFGLGDDVPRDRQFGAWSVSADVSDAGLKVPVEGRRLSAMKGPVTIAPGTASGEIEGRIDGIPAKISFNRPFGAAPVGEKRLAVSVSLDDGQRQTLVPALDGIVSGPIAATILQGADPGLKASVELKDSALTLPWIGWRKGKGVAAQLGFDLVSGADGTELKNLVLKGDGFSASGSVTLDKQGLRSAALGAVALNPGDDVSVAMQRASNGFSVRVDGKRFDARPFLADLKANLGAKASGASSGPKRQVDVSASVDSVAGFGNQQLADFSLNYAGSAGRVAALSISGRTKGGVFAADMSPRGAENAISLRTPDAGSLADFSGLYDRMEGGAVTLSLQGTTDAGYRGSIAAENFTLIDEPRLSRLVGSSPSANSASLSQAVGTQIRTERAFFDHASAGIGYGKGGLRLTDGIIRGPVFGSSFSGIVYDQRNRIDIVGSFMPAYGLNRIFGAIPVFGQILGNGNEGGLIGITYRLDGDFASPTLTVNPISAIAPGIFRSIFAYQ